MWRHWCIWSSWALLPMAALLLFHESLWGWLYLNAATTAFVYHWFEQKRFYLLDHALAWACIAANFWLAWNTHDVAATVAGVCAVGLALISYRNSHAEPMHYDRHHTVWHVWCGVAGWCLAQGYVGK